MPAGAFQLITAEEAALPPAPARPAFILRGSPTRRPEVVVVSPRATGLVHSPLDVKLQFRAFGGSRIDPDSVAVTYLKQPPIDITQRITPFIKPDGIAVLQAEVPPGLHKFWIQLRDMDGRTGGSEFTFEVAR